MDCVTNTTIIRPRHGTSIGRINRVGCWQPEAKTFAHQHGSTLGVSTHLKLVPANVSDVSSAVSELDRRPREVLC